MIKYSGMAFVDDLKIEEKTAVAIGKFDGIHKGHQKLLSKICSFKEKGYRTVVLTFDMPLASFFSKEDAKILTTNMEKEDYLEEMGIDIIIEFPINERTMSIEPESFVEDILVKKMNAGIIAAGADCSFGYKGRGNFPMLKKLGEKYNYQAILVEKECFRGKEISSTYVREEVFSGNMETVHELLGRDYAIAGKVVHGRKLGRTMNMPTVNLIPPDCKILPPFGVYMSKVIVGSRWYDGITNIGRKPTISEHEAIGIETYIFDFDDDLYGEFIQVNLIHFYRREMKFQNISELKMQLDKDLMAGEEFRKGQCLSEL